MAVEPLGTLRAVVAHLGSFQLPMGEISQETVNQIPLIRGRLNMRGAVVGIKQEGGEYLYDFAEWVFTKDPRYQRGTTFDGVLAQVTNIIIEELFERDAQAITSADLKLVEDKFAAWFSQAAAERRPFIPCNIMPYPASSFNVGPVLFRATNVFIQEESAARGKLFQPILDDMRKEGAIWIADVMVPDCDLKRADELGDLSVDIALAGIQLIVPLDASYRMTRMNARAVPSIGRSMIATGDQISLGNQSQYPGFGLSTEVFQQMCSQGAPILQSVGRRVEGFVTGRGKLHTLSQAWCDAAYWFHEGIAEPLDTIAVPKLETAIEVLLRSENSLGSEKRLLAAIKMFYGLEANQPINPISKITVKEFAKGLVRDRSRILHGTWSTLSSNLTVSRSSLTSLVRTSLLSVTLALDQFAEAPGAKDDINVFLNWMKKRILTHGTAVTPPTNA